MSYQDPPPRRQRLSRYPALASYEDSYPSYQDTQAGYDGYMTPNADGFGGVAGASPQRPPWEDGGRAGWDSPAGQDRAADTQQRWNSGTQQGWGQDTQQAWGQDTQQAWNSGPQQAWSQDTQQGWNSGPQQAWGQDTQQGWGQDTQQAWGQDTQQGWDAAGQQNWQPTVTQPAVDDRRGSDPFRALRGDSDQFRALRGDPAAPQRGGRRAVRHAGRGGEEGIRATLPGGLVGLVSAAVAIGVANLVAAFVRPQASPIIAVGEAFIDRTPSWLKNFAVEKFGENDKNVLLGGMYVTIAIIAIVLGMIAWRHLSVGVVGIGVFGLFGAVVALTRPESHVTDVIPSIVGGIVGIAAILWLMRLGLPRSRARSRYRTGWAGGNS